MKELDSFVLHLTTGYKSQVFYQPHVIVSMVTAYSQGCPQRTLD